MLGCPLFNHLHKTNGETPQPYLRADIQELRQYPQSEARQRQQDLQRLHQRLARSLVRALGFAGGEFHRHEDQRQHDQHAADDQIRRDHLRHHLGARRFGHSRWHLQQLGVAGIVLPNTSCWPIKTPKMIPSELKICEKLMRWVEVSSGPSRLGRYWRRFRGTTAR